MCLFSLSLCLALFFFPGTFVAVFLTLSLSLIHLLSVIPSPTLVHYLTCFRLTYINSPIRQIRASVTELCYTYSPFFFFFCHHPSKTLTTLSKKNQEKTQAKLF